jgi:hypothetical protein
MKVAFNKAEAEVYRSKSSDPKSACQNKGIQSIRFAEQYIAPMQDSKNVEPLVNQSVGTKIGRFIRMIPLYIAFYSAASTEKYLSVAYHEHAHALLALAAHIEFDEILTDRRLLVLQEAKVRGMVTGVRAELDFNPHCRPESIIPELACLLAGGVSRKIYLESEHSDLLHQLETQGVSIDRLLENARHTMRPGEVVEEEKAKSIIQALILKRPDILKVRDPNQFLTQLWEGTDKILRMVSPQLMRELAERQVKDGEITKAMFLNDYIGNKFAVEKLADELQELSRRLINSHPSCSPN